MPFDPLQYVLNLFGSLPFWTQIVILLLVLARLGVLSLFMDRATSPGRRRRRRRHSDDLW